MVRKGGFTVRGATIFNIEILSAPSDWTNTDGVIKFKLEDLDPDVQVNVSPSSDLLSGPDAGGKYTSTLRREPPRPWPGALAQGFARRAFIKVPRACPWGSTYSREMQITAVTITATDSNQKSAQDSSVCFGIDKTAPVTIASISEIPNPAGWINTLPVTVSFSATDNLSGITWNNLMSPLTRIHASIRLFVTKGYQSIGISVGRIPGYQSIRLKHPLPKLSDNLIF